MITPPTADLSFAFSPSGRQIAWSDGSAIYRSPSGGGAPALGTSQDGQLGAWGLPGIAFSVNFKNGRSEVFIVRADGGGLRRLTKTTAGSFSGYEVNAFSRDGRRLLVSSAASIRRPAP